MLRASYAVGATRPMDHSNFRVSTNRNFGMTKVTVDCDYLLESSPTLRTAKNAS
jgi:hypothetical protein